jgi:excisionase family DNA binding protein
LKDKFQGPLEKLLTIRELAELLSISTGTAYHWLSEGRLTCVRFSARCVRFREEDIEKMLQQMTDQGNPIGNEEER